MESRIEDILSATIGGKSYNKPSESRIETLLINLKEQIDDKVDKVSGKGLSTNDFTTAEKTKLDDLAEIKSIGTGLALDDSTGELVTTGGSGGGGTLDYTELINKPQINSVILSGNKSLSDLGITYESKTAASDGMTLSLVTTGEKHTWNNKQSNIDDLSTIRSGAALGATAVQPETGKGLSTNDYTTAEKTKLAGIAEGAEVNVQSNWTQTTTTADDYIKNKPTLGTAAAKNATDTYNATGTDVTTGKAVAAALATLPEPMVFKGSLGTGGTITTLPTASSSNKGYVYKVITAGTYASQSAKVGDTFISDGSAWVLIPSGDEPSGTVANVAVANGGGLTVSGSPITSSGTITVGHSNSVTAKTSSSVKKFTYDAYGHITDSSELSAAESDALASGIDSTKVDQIETNKNNISTDEAALVELVDEGAKNYINNTLTSGATPSGNISYTVNSDKSITITGSTATANADIVIPFSVNTSGTYVLTGGAAGGGSITYKAQIALYPSMNGVAEIYDNTFKEVALTAGIDYAFRFRVYSGKAVPNCTIYPMVCTKAAWDISHAYVPYRPPYQELYEKVETNKNNISTLESMNGAKNFAQLTYTGSTVNNVTYTVSNGIITTNGNTTNASTNIVLTGEIPLPTGDYVLMDGLTTSSHQINLTLRVNNVWKGTTATDGKFDFTVVQGDTVHIELIVANNQSTAGVVFKPMILSKVAYNAGFTDFQPYAMSNAEITAWIQAHS
jgi:hypothetical protein